MDIQQLRYAAALARELHFNRAAKSMHVTQPTLSQQIKKLEHELGKPLFERSPQKVQLTPAGKTFIPYALSVLEQLQKGIGELQEESGVISGTVRVGAIPTICPYLMPDIIVRLEDTAPKVRLEISEETTSILLENLKAGRLDICLIALPLQDRGIAVRSIGREPFYLAAASSNPLSKKRSVTRKDILKEKLLILQEGHCFGLQSLQFCKLSRRDPHVIFQGSSLTSVMALAEAGRGVTFVPEMARARAGSFDLKFIPIASGEQPYREIGSAWRVTSPLTHAQRAFLEVASTAFIKGKARG